VNLEQLRKQAKELVRSAQAGGEHALARLSGREATLANAQLVLAREHGYASWPALVAAVEADAEAFVRAATDRRRVRAEAMLAARPEIERDPWARLVLGRDWHGDPNEPGGPRGWAPLLYVCHSVFASPRLARELLDRGADPNASFVNEYGPMSAIYGAAGVVHDPELTRVLLEAGANPDDNESVYHSVEAQSTGCLRLLLEHGATVNGTNALPHALDDERLEHVRLLLEAGADPNAGAILVHAIRRGRGPEYLRLLLEHGADLDRRGGEWSRCGEPGLTAYQHAVRRGRRDVAETLAELGASTATEPLDEALGALSRGDRPAVPLPPDVDEDAGEILILSALWRATDVVADLVGPDFAGRVGGSPRGTLLHHAAWVGRPEVVRELLARGADPNARSDVDFETPLAWCALGSQYWNEPGGRDYVAVAEVLAAAGAELEPRFVEVADGPLYDWLAERLG
jgi:ankyrin repeat protein